MSIDLQALGITQEEIQERVVNAMCDVLLHKWTGDSEAIRDEGDEGDDYSPPASLHKKLKLAVERRIDKVISDLADKHVLPKAGEIIEGMMLQKTDEWGQKKGEPISFVKYLIERAEAYMNEKVNYDGKSKAESGSYNWEGRQTRLVNAVDRHLHHHIEEAMKATLVDSQKALTSSILETCRIQLVELSQKIKGVVTLPR